MRDSCTRPVCVALALMMAAWMPLWCCCLAGSHAEAAGPAAAASPAGGHCHVHHAPDHGNEPGDRDEAPGPETCQCPATVWQRATESPEPVWLGSGGRTAPDPLVLAFNPQATAAALSSEDSLPPFRAGRDLSPRPQCAPSLLALHTLLTI